MVTLYYGDGACNIEGSNNIKGVQIHYTGDIHIIDKTPDGYELLEKNNTILIFAINSDKVLHDLFEYKGYLKIKSILVGGNNGEKLNSTIRRSMDYAELIQSNAEDMTINSEDLNVTHRSGYVKKSSINVPTINNLNTDNYDIQLFLGSGEAYTGAFHIYKKNMRTMSGAYPNDSSKLLYTEVDNKKKPVSIKTTPVRKNKKKLAVKIKKINKDGSRMTPRFPNKNRYTRKVRIKESTADKY